MNETNRSSAMFRIGKVLGLMALGCTVTLIVGRELQAGSLWKALRHGECNSPGCAQVDGIDEGFGTWYWLHSPEEERRAVAGFFNRYCIRCHGIDGRGQWDIPGVPDFTNAAWQGSRTDGQIARIIMEGRGAVMPPFRGTLSLEEAWGMARYLRTFAPGSEMPRPDFGKPGAPPANEGNQAPKAKPGPVGLSSQVE